MGTTYRLMVAKRSDLPKKALKEGYDPWDFKKRFSQVGEDLDCEDWLGEFISRPRGKNAKTLKSGVYLENVKGAISELRRLDREVDMVWADERYPVAVRKRLVQGLVRNIFEHREYHYGYPKGYSSCSDGGGSSWYVEQLKKLLPYLNGRYEVWIMAT